MENIEFEYSSQINEIQRVMDNDIEYLNNFLIQRQSQQQSQILPKLIKQEQSQKSQWEDKTNTKGTSRRDKNKSAAQRYRQKRKTQINQLQENVKLLERQISQCDEQLIKVKQKLHHNLNISKNTNEHRQTYAQLSLCINTEEPDIDKINLLLDTLKYRIGANGKERQAIIDYNFKQIVNTVFPALHRYLMYTAYHNLDLFSSDESKLEWTKQIYTTIQISQKQVKQISQMKQKFINVRCNAKLDIYQLNQLKIKLKSEEEIVQNFMDDLRREMNPVQSSQWILFCEKNKYRRCIAIQFDDEFDQTTSKPRKMRKIQ